MALAPIVTARTRNLTSSHWGVYELVPGQDVAQDVTLKGLAQDPDPSPIGLSMVQAYRSKLRVQRPAIRKSWLDNGPGAASHKRGVDPFVEVEWPKALDLVAAEIERVRSQDGNRAIFGGSYGWASAGRFHHAQSQIHRFLNSVGGYVRHVDSYSLGAARVLMPHIVATMDELMNQHHSWQVLVDNTRLMVCFGGVPAKNAQISPGGVSEHGVRKGLAALAQAGCRFVNFSPIAIDLDAPRDAIEWQAIRPGSDTAVMLALATTIVGAGKHDRAFLESYCVGFEQVRRYLLGETDGIVKNARWASALSGVPAARIESLAMQLCTQRSLVNVSWSMQRSDHGEQPFWAVVLLGCVIGQVGLPGGGFGVGYGAVNLMGSGYARIPQPTLSQLQNPVQEFIPVARIADLLLKPGAAFDYNGQHLSYPDIKLVYWAGGNPFHHHQDLNRLQLAWRKPQTIVVHEQVWTATAKHADIVLPVTTTMERADIGSAGRDPLWVAMKPMMAPPGQARDDYAIFSDLAQRLGAGARFTEGRNTEQWLRHLYDEARVKLAAAGVPLPSFDAFWSQGAIDLPQHGAAVVMLADFRRDPVHHPLATPSGKIELFSERIASFGYPDCPGHVVWQEPVEWLGAALAERLPLHLLSDQPINKLHSQLDFSALSRAGKIAGREPLLINRHDALARGVGDGDVVRVFNDRGACLAGAALSDQIMPGVVKLSTGAWFDPVVAGAPGSLEKHGNPNVLTRDVGASSLSQGCAAQSCLVQVERYLGVPPPVTAFELPTFVAASQATRT